MSEKAGNTVVLYIAAAVGYQRGWGVLDAIEGASTDEISVEERREGRCCRGSQRESIERRFLTALEWIWETRDSETPRRAPISRKV